MQGGNSNNSFNKAINMTNTGNLRTVFLLLGLVLGIIVIGIAGFMIIENYRLLDAFYMTIITIGTVGFKEVNPLSDSGNIFTAILIILSFGSFGYVITNFTKFMFEGILKIILILKSEKENFAT